MKSKWLLILMIALMATVLGISDHNALAYAGCGGGIAPVVNANYEQQVLDSVNTTRANLGLPPLKRETTLDQAARYHSTDMGQDNYFDHNSYDRVNGSLTQVCLWSARVVSFYGSNWASLGENIAAGYSTPQAVMTGWINSPGHYANIISTSNWEIGVGYATVNGSSYSSYWTQDFGRRNGVYPLIINRDAAATSSCDVSLYIYSDGALTQMRLQNDSGAWGNWITFQSNLNWTLAAGAGTHTVNAQLKKGTSTYNTSDSIVSTVGQCGAGYKVYLPLLLR